MYLYDHTNSKRKLLKKANMSEVDKAYKERTLFATEVQQIRKKRQKIEDLDKMNR